MTNIKELVKLGLRLLKNRNRFRLDNLISKEETVYLHTIRTYLFVKYIEDKFTGEGLDFKYLKLFSLLHDMAEIKTKDIPLTIKCELSEVDLSELKNKEKNFLDSIINKNEIKEILSYDVEKIVEDILFEKSPEAKFFKLIDYLDAHFIIIEEYLMENEEIFNSRRIDILKKWFCKNKKFTSYFDNTLLLNEINYKDYFEDEIQSLSSLPVLKEWQKNIKEKINCFKIQKELNDLFSE
jgi:5'-deoxynucleotidase YfbR-like HD superfamily hydrolase